MKNKQQSARTVFIVLVFFFVQFSKNATNSSCMGSYGVERGIEGKRESPSSILTQRGGESV